MNKQKYLPLKENTPVEIWIEFKLNFSYNSKTGEIINLKTGNIHNKTSKQGYVERVTLSFNKQGYRIVPHRLAWYLFYGEILKDSELLDHKDRNKANNKIENLRKCSWVENNQNKAKDIKNNNNKYKGVGYYCYDGKNYYYTASINGRSIVHLQDEETAAKFYDAAARFYFGKFAYVNFIEEFIPSMDIDSLRHYYKTNIKKDHQHSRFKSVRQYTLDGDFVKDWNNPLQAAKSFGASEAYKIYRCCKGEKLDAYGYIWKYKENSTK